MNRAHFAARGAVLLAVMQALPVYAQLRLPEVRVEDTRNTPLGFDTPADSATRLGLTVRETPATIDVVDKAMIRDRGYRTTSEAAQGAVGVTSGDAPGAPGAFSMRGFSFSQINTLYNGIKIGPSSMTSRVTNTGDLERIEFLKGPSSLMSGEGAAGGAVNYVSKRPHTGAIENDSYLSYGSFNTVRAGFGSGGSTAKEGLDYRFDLNAASSSGFIDDTHSENWSVSTGLDYKVSSALKVFAAFEYIKDKSNAYWGTPLVAGSAPGINPRGGIVGGVSTASISGNPLGPVTIDNRTLTTNYNVTDNHNEAQQYWLRGGLEWALRDNLTLRNQLYGYNATRQFFNSETYSFDPTSGLVDRDRFFVAHYQKLIGNKTELEWNTTPGGMDNRAVLALEFSRTHFDPQQSANFPNDSVTLVDPIRGTYGSLLIQDFTTRVGNKAIAAEDRLKITPTFAVVAGLRYEEITLGRSATDPTGGSDLPGKHIRV